MDLVFIILVFFILLGLYYASDWVIRKFTRIKKDEESHAWVNRLHQNIHFVLILSFFIGYFFNITHEWINSSLFITIFIFTLFTFHALIQRLFLKNSKEYVVTFLTGIFLTSIASLFFYFLSN